MTAAATVEVVAEPTAAPVRTADVVRSEWIKLWSVRSTAWTLTALVALGVGLTAVVCATSAEWLASPEADEAPEAFLTWGMMIAQVTALVLGVLVVSGEYGTGMIRTTLAASPRRGRVLFAKCAVLTGVLFVAGAATASVGYFAGNAFLEAHDVGVGLGEDGVVRALVGSGLYVAVLGLFAAAIAFLVRHTAAAISLALAVVFVGGNLVMLVPGTVGDWLTKLMPGNAGSSLGTVVNFNPDLLGPWTGFGVLCLETGVLLALAAVRFVRRDA